MTAVAIDVRGLRVELGSGDDVVDDVTFSVRVGEVLGIVGESGSGKTTIGTSVLGYVRRGARISAGDVLVDGVDVTSASPAELRRVRGGVIAYVPQDPAAGLNPARRIGSQVRETLATHDSALSDAQLDARVKETMADVRLPNEDTFLARYPHQLSGGQQQRVMLAMAFITQPKAIVLDEPTTGLDVTTQAHILETVRRLCKSHEVAAIYVSHDLALVRSLADRVVVAYAGRVVEAAATETIFVEPAHPYSRGLLSAIPDVGERRVLVPIPGQAPAPGHRAEGCSFAPRCPYAIDACRQAEPPVTALGPDHDVRCIRAREIVAQAQPFEVRPTANAAPVTDGLLVVRDLKASYGNNEVLHGVSFAVERGRCVALVGESGSGKSTLSRCLIGLHREWEGTISYQGEELQRTARQRTPEARHSLQYIFQNPYQALNPRHAVRESIAAPLRHFFGVTGQEAERRIADVLDQVSLPARLAERRPRELSGGERQRVAIARALVCEPEIMICDEITSALDVSVQASILVLLEQLQKDRGLTLLFVTHNLAVVRTIATEVLVMHEGHVVESGAVGNVLDHPAADYTRELVADSPTLSVGDVA